MQYLVLASGALVLVVVLSVVVFQKSTLSDATFLLFAGLVFPMVGMLLIPLWADNIPNGLPLDEAIAFTISTPSLLPYWIAGALFLFCLKRKQPMAFGGLEVLAGLATLTVLAWSKKRGRCCQRS